MAGANTPRENFGLNPAVRATDANKDLSLKNFQAKSRWSMLVKKIDLQKKEREHQITEEQNKLLKYREKLQSTTSSFVSAQTKKEDEDEQESVKEEPKKMTFMDVYRSLMEAARKDKETVERVNSNDSQSPRDKITSRGTLSSQQKRTKKRFSYSLNDLQKATSSVQSKKDETSQNNEETQLQPDDMTTERRPHSLLEYTEDDEAIGPLRLPPTSLPKIYQQREFKPLSRRFDYDDHFKKHINGSGTKIEDLRYCRYLRSSTGTKRRNTAPSLNFRQLHHNVDKKL